MPETKENMTPDVITGSDDLATTSVDVDVTQHQPADPADSQVQVSEPNDFRSRAAKAVSEMFQAPSEEATDEEVLTEETDDDPVAEEETDEPVETAEEEKTPEKESRVNRFKATVAENEQLTTRLSEIDSKLEKFGGVEGFEVLGNVLDAFMNLDGKFEIEGENGEKLEVSGKDIVYDFVNELPERDAVYSDFFLKGLENESNRVFAINDVLKQEFGLKADVNINQDQINKVFDFLTAKVNTATTPAEIEKIFQDLEFETKELGYDGEEFSMKTENEKLKAEIEALKNPQTANQQKTEIDPVEAFQKEIQQSIENEQKHYKAQDDLIVNLFDTVAVDLLGKAGWAAAAGDSDSAKTSKQKFADIVLGKDNVAQRIRNTDAFKKAAGYLKNGNLENSRTGQIAMNSLKIAMTAQVTSLLKDLSLLAEETPTTKQPTKPGNKPRSEITANTNSEEKLNFRQKANQYRQYR